MLIVNQDGKKIGRIGLPGYPEIVSLSFSQQEYNTLYAIANTENREQPQNQVKATLFRFEVKETNLEKSEKEKASQY